MDIFQFLGDNKESFFMLLGGLGVFLYGIKLMGDSLKAYAGDDLRDIINKYTSSPLKGVLVGALSTVVIQSSSGTTALTISLVRAGLMDLRQAIGVIMGANIGTTITAFLLGLAIKDYALPIMFVGAAIFMFSSNRKKSLIGQIIFGFGALFYGMVLMETPLKELASTPWFTDVMTTVASNPFLGVLIGTGLTMLVQSSSATIGILEGLYATGALGFPVAISILLGDNLGTTITSILASLGGSKDAKRAALSHVMFNLFGSILFFIILYVLNGISVWEHIVSGLKPEMQIAMSHLAFNFSVTFILIWFVRYIELAVKTVIPVGEDEKEIDINDHYLDLQLAQQAPALAIDQAREGLINLALTVETQMKSALAYIDNGEKLDYESVVQLEIGINALDKKLKTFFMELSAKDLNDDDSKALSGYMYSINEFERIGDLTEKIILNIQRLNSEKIKLSDDANNEIKKMFVVALSSAKKARQLYESGDITLAGRIVEKERQLDRMERKYYKAHLSRVKLGTCTGKNAIEYVDLISDVERIGDHAENISEYFTNANQVLTDAEEDFDISELLHDIHA
ncbi:Na/Pi cotransporter family protein [Mollicutes bacterium LVI A0078]|nr:Na/Pi cotransporter family protein [Mollicutes bacterium LVI A0075]WOO90624.1 Na/Pi cotransporter family protein [Mollicutes bacterium LVI A0078]